MQELYNAELLRPRGAHCLNSNRQKAVFIQTAFSIMAKTILKFNSHTKQYIIEKSLIFSILLLIIVIISV